MRGFWQQIGRLDQGVLFPLRRDIGAGMKELAALSGISYAYKRVAGELKKTNAERLNSTTTGTDAPAKAETMPALLEALKPIASLLAGTAVTVVTATTAGSAGTSSTKNIGFALLMGLFTTIFAQAVFRYSTTSVRTDVDTRDETFIPTTNADTLERVLPELVARLLDAGLAPVIVIDELDKVDDLWKKLERYEVLDQFKKLFAERVFTCLLVNRDFIERLDLKSEQEPYARFHSYFTHRTYVSFEPAELHDYLERLIEPVHD
ncbi:hypothetical protein CDL60_00650 [Roseateles noduli]|nr:hypothetical protein CDL60_00650 [Roseateles noduli]